MEAVIFDMDGVIVDSEPVHERAFLSVAEEIGYGRTHGLRFADYIGRSDEVLWAEFTAKHNPRQTPEVLLEMKTVRTVEILRRERPVFDGVVPLIQNLSTRYILALASGSERPVVEAVLDLNDLRQSFSATVTGSDIRRGKPEPDIFLRTAELLHVAPKDCWVIEDSQPGVAAALAAGMRAIAITNTHRARELRHATQVVRTYQEIERLLLGATSG